MKLTQQQRDLIEQVRVLKELLLITGLTQDLDWLLTATEQVDE